MELIFDIETNGLLPDVDTLHCVGYSVDGGEAKLARTPDELATFFKLLTSADVLIGHNIQGYDIPVLRKLHLGVVESIKDTCKIHDTLIMAKVIHSDIAEKDAAVVRRRPEIRPYIGRHNLEAWGVRLKCHKGDFGKHNGWEEYTPAMGAYCKQDVEVTKTLYNHLRTRAEMLTPEGLDAKWVKLEHEFSAVMDKMMKVGVPFNVHFAEQLAAELSATVVELRMELEDALPGTEVKMKTPQYWELPESGERFLTKSKCVARKRKLLQAGPMKVKKYPFNPNSRDDIARYLMEECGWKPGPDDFTPTGKPKISETILSGLDFPKVKQLRKYLLTNKRLSQLQDGAKAWLKCVKEDSSGGPFDIYVIRGRIDHNATVTHRCAHSGPNLGQAPAVRHEWGKEMRQCFGHSLESLWNMVGSDLSQLELRMLAHFLAEFDGGEYIKLILEGDIHTANQKAAGLETRDQAKTFIYALIYGAGDAKIGEIIGGTAADGRRIKRRFFKKMPAFKKLQDKLKAELKDGYLISPLDGRRLPVRSEHKLLNVLLQSSGAIVAKQWNVNIDHWVVKKEKVDPSSDFFATKARQVLFVHDEVQWAFVSADICDDLGAELVQAANDIQEQFDLKIPIDADYSVGRTWAETH